MKRRAFLKSGLALGSTACLHKMPANLFAMSFEKDSNGTNAYQIGEKISDEIFVHGQDMNRQNLLSLCSQRDDVLVNVLYIFGGGAMGKEGKLGGLWCKDSFEDLSIFRFISAKYEDMAVQFIPVACAPVYSTHYYDFDERVFLDEGDDSEKFQKAAKAFVESTQESLAAGFIPQQPYFDLRNRLLFNKREDLLPGKSYGEIYAWQGRFRAENETQKYGVPSIWLLNPEGVVLDGPFRGNYYHSDPYEIGYTIVDIDGAINRHL